MSQKRCILVIDDDKDVGELVHETAQAMGLTCSVTCDAPSFVECLNPDTVLIFLDLVMPGMDGVELLRLLSQRKCSAGIVLMSGVGKRVMEAAAELAQMLGLSIVAHLQKPFRIRDLEAILQQFTSELPHPAAPRDTVLILPDEDLRRAIDNNEFVLHYQPQIDIATGCILGVEALVRWRHAHLGLVYPDNFISRLESLELIDELGWAVLQLAFSQLPLFAGDDGVLPLLSVNVSVQTLRDLRFPDEILSLALQHGIPPGRLILEITEGGLIQELSSALDVLTRLRMKQIGLSIDDFGTGYAMMRQLKLIPATELKIDKSFVQNMLCDDRSRVLVLKTIEIGHELGMKVIAEGVENIEQLDFLRNHGCDIAQGYLFSRPLPPPELRTWLRNYRTAHPAP